MTPEEYAREGLLRCIDKPRYLEAYEPEIATAIRAAVKAEREACALFLNHTATALRSSARSALDDEEQLQLQARANHLDFLAGEIRARE